MDGFDTDAKVIVLGATNRPEVLDPALLRPGRFDRRVFVQAPDANGREAILRVHTRSVPFDDEVDLAQIARSTPGMVGADLANLANEAALLAARRGHERVKREDITDALEKIILGAERKVLMSVDDRRRTAYHEGGHAVVGMLTPGADPVRKVSIIPRGMALGVTLSTPEDDRFNYSEHELRAKIRVSLGGRVAEELVFGEATTGAESDIQQVTRIARGMVRALGHEREGGLPHGCAAGRPEPAAARRRAGLGGHPGADRRGGAPDRGRGAGGHRAAARREPRAARLARRGAARARDARRGRRLRGRRHRAARPQPSAT